MKTIKMQIRILIIEQLLQPIFTQAFQCSGIFKLCLCRNLIISKLTIRNLFSQHLSIIAIIISFIHLKKSIVSRIQRFEIMHLNEMKLLASPLWIVFDGGSIFFHSQINFIKKNSSFKVKSKILNMSLLSNIALETLLKYKLFFIICCQNSDQ